MRPSYSLVLLPLSLALIAGCGRPGGGGGGGGGGTPGGDLVAGLDIASVTINQAVSIELDTTGDALDSRARVVEGRPAVIRAFVEPEDGWDGREVVGVLEFEDGEVYSDEKAVDDDSSISSMSSTFNFSVPGSEIVEDAAFTISLRELDAPSAPEGNTNGATWPGETPAVLDTRDPGGPVTVVLVPIRYNNDGSGRLPDISDDHIETLRNEFFKQYPVAEVDFVVAEPWATGRYIDNFGTGWGELLDEFTNWRSGRANFGEYYYGLFSPRSSYEEFCQGACIAGLSWRPESPFNDGGRASIGLGYPGFDGVSAAGIMVHEVGHAHGREHAPCGLGNQPSDASYPYSQASIGTWGYDIVDGGLKSPNQYTDFMAYCDPTWVSDYTFGDLQDWVRDTNSAAAWVVEAAPLWWSSYVLSDDGATATGTTLFDRPPGAESVAVELLDGNGNVLEEVDARFMGFNHLPGGGLWVPQQSGAVSARLADGTVLAL